MNFDDLMKAIMNLRKNMNEETLMNMRPGSFSPVVNNAYDIVMDKVNNKKTLHPVEETILIFPHIFATNGFTQDLDLALSMTEDLHNRVMSKMPLKKENSEEYDFWTQGYAVSNALFGLIYAYQKEYIKSMYHFMVSLKTNNIELSAPFCDFIAYILNKVTTFEAKVFESDGYGFSSEKYAGNKSGEYMFPSFAEEFITDLEGNNGEVILLKKGSMQLYGHIQRLGSIIVNHKGIDIYETYMIDKEYKLFKVKLYINNYCKASNNEYILPSGFSLVWNSKFQETN